MSTSETYRLKLENKKAKRDLLQTTVHDMEMQAQAAQERIDNLAKARWVVTEVGRQTQTKVKSYIEELVTMVIQSVYDDPNMKFILDFELSRNRSEAFLYIKEGDSEPYVPKDEMGGGVIDIVSLALRVVLWSLQKPRSRNVFILDEPFKWLGTGGRLIRGGEILREISHRLGFQLIIVTHEPELIEIADRAWGVTREGKISKVERVK